MKLLLVILSAIMSWFVASKSKVTCEDAYPKNMQVSYACTYQKGDVRAGDTAKIAFTNMAGMTIERIEVYVKSNKSSGAGEFTVIANGATVTTKSGSFKDWFLEYDKDTYHPIALLSGAMKGVEELSVTLVGTTNSLHIEKYVIEYAEAAPRTVTLMNGNEVYTTLTETAAGAGVTLPLLPDITSWEFEAWSPKEFWETDHISYADLLFPETKCFPAEDMTLWAVYKQDSASETSSYVTELATGVYIYENSAIHKVMSGVPENGIMESEYLDVQDEQQHYLVEFQSDTTAFITHAPTHTPIGYSSAAALVAEPSLWKVYHEGEETLFYAAIGKKNYVLWPDLTSGDGSIDYTGLRAANPGPSPIRLRSTLIPERMIVYTCHPEAQGLENIYTNGLQNERTLMRFGAYELILRNGQKELIVW